jgi:hypothetical protein
MSLVVSQMIDPTVGFPFVRDLFVYNRQLSTSCYFTATYAHLMCRKVSSLQEVLWSETPMKWRHKECISLDVPTFWSRSTPLDVRWCMTASLLRWGTLLWGHACRLVAAGLLKLPRCIFCCAFKWCNNVEMFSVKLEGMVQVFCWDLQYFRVALGTLNLYTCSNFRKLRQLSLNWS